MKKELLISSMALLLVASCKKKEIESKTLQENKINAYGALPKFKQEIITLGVDSFSISVKSKKVAAITVIKTEPLPGDGRPTRNGKPNGTGGNILTV